MIVLFTDFGLHGPYTGQMKAVLHQMAPAVPVIDLFADAPVGNPKAAAYLLAAYAQWFVAGTAFLCVVDPGARATNHGFRTRRNRRYRPADAVPPPPGRGGPGYFFSRTNADDRLPLTSLGRVEGGDGFVEGRDVADVRPQSSLPRPP